MATTYEYEDEFFLGLGLIQIWWNEKLCPPTSKFKDPPRLRKAVMQFLQEHSARYAPNTVIGPPLFIFRSDEDRALFIATFDAGEVPVSQKSSVSLDEALEAARERGRAITERSK